MLEDNLRKERTRRECLSEHNDKLVQHCKELCQQVRDLHTWQSAELQPQHLVMMVIVFGCDCDYQ